MTAVEGMRSGCWIMPDAAVDAAHGGLTQAFFLSFCQSFGWRISRRYNNGG